MPSPAKAVAGARARDIAAANSKRNPIPGFPSQKIDRGNELYGWCCNLALTVLTEAQPHIGHIGRESYAHACALRFPHKIVTNQGRSDFDKSLKALKLQLGAESIAVVQGLQIGGT
jgi:hypothetical protein